MQFVFIYEELSHTMVTIKASRAIFQWGHSQTQWVVVTDDAESSIVAVVGTKVFLTATAYKSIATPAMVQKMLYGGVKWSAQPCDVTCKCELYWLLTTF